MLVQSIYITTVYRKLYQQNKTDQSWYNLLAEVREYYFYLDNKFYVLRAIEHN